MENPEEKTTEEDVNTSSESTDQKTTEEPDYKSLLEAKEQEAQAHKDEAQRLKDQLRSQSEKHSEKAEAPKPDELAVRLGTVEQRFKAVEEAERSGALAKVKEEDWYTQYTSDNDPDGKDISRFNEMVKVVNREFPPTSVDDRVLNFRRAELLLHPTQASQATHMVNESARANYEKSMAAGASGGTAQKAPSQRLSEEQIKMAELCGNDPTKVY